MWSDGTRWDAALYASFAEVWDDHSDARAVLVDMPVGLPEAGERKSDRETRKRLGPMKSSLFNTPTRSAVYAPDKRTAKSVNKALTGKSLTEQSLNLMVKIREIDGFLRAQNEALGLLYEAHPELCFAHASGAPMRYSKRDSFGAVERYKVIAELAPELVPIARKARASHPMTKLAGDDILDACILAVTAWRSDGKLQSLPAVPERDEEGLPMAIWYYDFGRSEGI